MEDEGIKKAVVLKKENINYFLGRYFMSFSVLVFEEQPYLYVGRLDKDYAEELFNFLEIREFKDWKEIFKGCGGGEKELPIGYLKYIEEGLREEIKRDLLSADIPIGKIIRKHNLETRREIKSISIAEIDDYLKILLKTNHSRLPKRTYNIIYKNKILMEITEIFAIRGKL